jgi:hypothetical protein
VRTLLKPIVIPRRFVSTHPTGGLPGYPAIDVFGEHNRVVMLDDRGRVRRISGRSPCRPCSRGGACGWSIYVEAQDGSDWFLTHFGVLLVVVGQIIVPDTILGTPLDARDAPGWSVEHIHAGRRGPRD